MPRNPNVAPVKPVRFAAKANIREVNWERDVPAGVNVPTQVKGQLLALSMEHTDIRKRLDILRKTRGQRDVGAVAVPAHLKQMELISDDGVRRLDRLPDGRAEEE